VVGPQSPYGRRSVRLPSTVLCVVRSEDAKFSRPEGVRLIRCRILSETNLEREVQARRQTIAMQLARNLFLWRAKSLPRKALELPDLALEQT